MYVETLWGYRFLWVGQHKSEMFLKTDPYLAFRLLYHYTQQVFSIIPSLIDGNHIASNLLSITRALVHSGIIGFYLYRQGH